MSTDLKTLCQRMADELDYYHIGKEGNDRSHLLACEARAALAESVADGPTVPESRASASVVGEPSDDELMELSQFHCVSITLSNGSAVSPFVEGTDIRSEVLSFARAAISRYGHQSAPPDEGEVANLVEFLRIYGDEVMDEYGDVGEHDLLTRAAELLSQRHPTPVPISERLPGPEDCDAEGRCWWWHVGEDGVGDWFQQAPYPSVTSYAFFRMTHWLPAKALPLPQGEVN